MGKVKPRHKNNRKHQTHPTGLPSVKDAEMEEAELGSSKDDTLVLNIIEEVQSLNIEERLNGLRSLADLAESSESVETIVKYKILKIIAPLLVDKSSEVRNITAGILRNLSATGSADICERLVKDDIMTPLLTLLQQYNDWKPESKTENSDTLLQAVNIIWNLCESDETALKYFNSANVLNILLRCLDYKTVGLDLSIAVCQCLNSVCEENTSVLSVLRSYESDLLTLLSICATDNKMILLKTLAAGIVVNLNPSAPWLASVLAVTAESLEKDLRTSVNQLSSQLPLDSAALSSEVATLVEQTEALTLAQTMALETLANLSSDQGKTVTWTGK
ncbi:HEAT repeat-containing protein 3-like [Macrosteles quadrilineatus]|uniref:HEAT repeat-containing protein 3-like n=1 Tax=Macrosteles quadrilineatus TaxID=74068 RepID=UPI0023E3291C|nr:HEAT repeat-containing protein 3-like [Macrosteles quadrilineatus]